jgi:hypothetical protein
MGVIQELRKRASELYQRADIAAGGRLPGGVTPQQYLEQQRVQQEGGVPVQEGRTPSPETNGRVAQLRESAAELYKKADVLARGRLPSGVTPQEFQARAITPTQVQVIQPQETIPKRIKRVEKYKVADIKLKGRLPYGITPEEFKRQQLLQKPPIQKIRKVIPQEQIIIPETEVIRREPSKYLTTAEIDRIALRTGKTRAEIRKDIAMFGFAEGGITPEELRKYLVPFEAYQKYYAGPIHERKERIEREVREAGKEQAWFVGGKGPTAVEELIFAKALPFIAPEDIGQLQVLGGTAVALTAAGKIIKVAPPIVGRLASAGIIGMEAPRVFKPTLTKGERLTAGLFAGTAVPGTGVFQKPLSYISRRKQIYAELDTILKRTPKPIREKFQKEFKFAKKYYGHNQPVKNLDLSRLKLLEKNPEAQREIIKYIRQNEDLVVGGSLAQQTQIKKGILTKRPGDGDFYVRGGNTKIQEEIGLLRAKQMSEILKRTGVKNVKFKEKIDKSGNKTGNVYVGKEKLFELHSYNEYYKANVEQIAPWYRRAESGLTKTPEGINVMDITAQWQRKLVGGYLEPFVPRKPGQEPIARIKDIPAAEAIKESVVFGERKPRPVPKTPEEKAMIERIDRFVASLLPEPKGMSQEEVIKELQKTVGIASVTKPTRDIFEPSKTIEKLKAIERMDVDKAISAFKAKEKLISKIKKPKEGIFGVKKVSEKDIFDIGPTIKKVTGKKPLKPIVERVKEPKKNIFETKVDISKPKKKEDVGKFITKKQIKKIDEYSLIKPSKYKPIKIKASISRYKPIIFRPTKPYSPLAYKPLVTEPGKFIPSKPIPYTPIRVKPPVTKPPLISPISKPREGIYDPIKTRPKKKKRIIYRDDWWRITTKPKEKKVRVKPKKRKVQAYNAYGKVVQKKGVKKVKYKKLNLVPLSRTKALDLGNYITDHTMSATFYIEPVPKAVKKPVIIVPQNYHEKNVKSFRNYRIKGGRKVKTERKDMWIELRNKRLSNKDEVKRITILKKLAELKKKKVVKKRVTKKSNQKKLKGGLKFKW